MDSFILTLSVISFLILVTGMLHKKIKQSFLSEPIIALVTGILLGPEVLNLLNMHEWGRFERIMEVASQVTISMALMTTAFRIPKNYLRYNGSLQMVLLGFGMLGMCLVSALLVHVILGFDWLLSFLIGAVITPTDPVVASSIVAGETARKLLPDRIRYAISFDSGANDGLALPLVFLPLLLMEKSDHVWKEWLLVPILWETLGGIIIGIAIGYVAGKLLISARDAGWMSVTVLLSFSLSLGFFALGLLELIGSNGILGVFAAGFAANRSLDKEEDIEQETIQESMERIFTIPIFVLLGLVLPWADWWELGWKAVWIVIGVLLFRRLPVIIALKPMLQGLPKTADLVMVGWFGPIGIAAVFYAVHSFSLTGLYEVWVIGSLIVFGSTIVHGLTGYHFAKLYSQWERT